MLKRTRAAIGADALLYVLGGVLISVGAGLVFLPAGLIAGGVLLIALVVAP